MVFPSLPVYLDPPNWHQQYNHQQGTFASGNPQLLPPLNPPTDVGAAGGGGGSIRSGSMADRAGLAKIPQPEAALKCPRCESTNTKFCYFNNYSLSQPRHFCKTCRRYWTLGGALRNVPVGGGCRRNKKNKSSNSKSAASSEKQVMNSNSANAVVPSEITGHLQITPHLPFMASLQNLSQFGLGEIGLNFGGIQGQLGATTTTGASGQADMGFPIGTNSGMSGASLSGTHQQFPFFEPINGLYPFQSEGSKSSSSRVSQPAPVKMENNRGLNLSRSPMGVSEKNQYYWGGNSWTDLSGLNASSTNHQL